MKRSTWESSALGSGLVAGIIQIAAFIVFGATAAPRMPPLHAPPAEHAAFYAQAWEPISVANYLYLLPIPFFLLFLGGLDSLMRRTISSSVPRTAALASGTALCLAWAGGIIVAHTGQSLARLGLDSGTVVGFDSVAQYALAMSGFPRTTFLVAASMLLFDACSWRWTGWTGIGLAALSLVSTATLVAPELYPLAALSVVAFNVWLVGTSSLLILNSAHVQAPAANR